MGRVLEVREARLLMLMKTGEAVLTAFRVTPPRGLGPTLGLTRLRTESSLTKLGDLSGPGPTFGLARFRTESGDWLTKLGVGDGNGG